jgi:hypothetical protein
MVSYRNKDESALTSVKAPTTYNLGNRPPLINWTIVTGDSAAFRIYVQDDLGDPIDVDLWTIRSQFRRYSDNVGDDLLFTLTPTPSDLDGPGEFTLSLTPAQSKQLLTGDVFDVQLSDATRVWTVCQGEMVMIGEVTDQES